jgi:hypothetical protein
MVVAKNEKLNRLQRILPEGLVVDTTWLDAQGYPKPLRDKYLASGWLQHVSRGVYQRPSAAFKTGRPLDWERVVISLQTLLDRPVTVGGRTALEMQGFGHYLSAANFTAAKREVHLYAAQPLPGWLNTLPTTAQWVTHKSDRLFVSPGRGLSGLSVDVRTNAAHNDDPIHGSFKLNWGVWDWPLTLSTPERALLELLDELPKRESFEQVDALFGGLATLSPRRLQRLLADCRSVKVKRLFFVFAERHKHRWLRQIDKDKVDLGAGKRSLVEHGKFDPNSQMTLPPFLVEVPDADF